MCDYAFEHACEGGTDRAYRGSYFEKKGPRQQRVEDRYKEAPHLATAASIGAWKGNFPKYE